LDESFEITHAVLVAVGERTDVEFIDDGVLIPEGIVTYEKVFSPSISHGACPLHEVVEITFRADSTPQAKDMCGNHLGIKLHIVPVAVPQVACLAQKVMYLKSLLKVDSQRLKGELHPTGMFVVRV
jgi:hypothetical protein